MDESLLRLGNWFEAAGGGLLAVGGLVRNRLLGLPTADTDVCAPVPAERVMTIQTDDYTVVPQPFGLGTVVIRQRLGEAEHTYEFTEFRRDSYGRGGIHRPRAVQFTDDIEADALRRDFTINALYANMRGEVRDPTGRGLEDLRAKTIRMTRPQTMAEDALRILRMVRFACELGFEIDEKTFAAAKDSARNLDNISVERLRDEFFKILMADTPYGCGGAVYRGLDLLRRLTAIERIVPGIAEGEDFAQSPKYHKYPVMEHLLRTCGAAAADLRVRLAALLHDFSKPAAYKRDGNMHDHPRMGAEAALTALQNLRANRALAEDVAQLVACHMFDLDNLAGRKAIVRMITKLGREQFLRLCMLREADFAGSGRGEKPKSAIKWRAVLRELEEQDAPIERSKLAINGDDIMRKLNIPPGRTVGGLLKKAHAHALKKPGQNNYKSLIRYAKMVYTDMIRENKHPDT
jgi:tRNA nucleotidyltransferase (CCA-adding enzyme)